MDQTGRNYRPQITGSLRSRFLRGYDKFLWGPCPFRVLEGEYIDAQPFPVNFVLEFTDYVWMQDWENMFGLEVIEGQGENMVEFFFDIGSFELYEDQIDEEGRARFTLQETGWSTRVNNSVMVELTNEKRCAALEKGHLP